MNYSTRKKNGSGVHECLSIQKRVVNALLLRELKTRFGKYRLGYFWALLQPILHMSIMLIVFGFIMRRTMPGISFPAFLICGLVPFFMFSGIATRSLQAIAANRGLLAYRPVHPVDTLIARALLEAVIAVAVFAILLAGLAIAEQGVALRDFPLLVATWVLLVLVAVGLGLIFMVVGHAFNEAEKIIPFLMRPLYFISGVMYPLTIIPQEYRWAVLWNPVLHALELTRNAVLVGYRSEDASLGYLAFCALACVGLGLLLYKGREPAIMRS